MIDNTHTESDRFVVPKPCPPCFDGRAKEFLIFAALVLAFTLGIAVGMKIRDGQVRSLSASSGAK